MPVVVINHLTLDGVTQAPAGADEDTRGGFQHGGWEVPYGDAMMMAALGLGPAQGDKNSAPQSGSVVDRSSASGLLLGRNTYEHFYRVWPKRRDNPYSEVLKTTTKGEVIAKYRPEDP